MFYDLIERCGCEKMNPPIVKNTVGCRPPELSKCRLWQDVHHHDHRDVMEAPWRFKSTTTRLFVLQLVQINHKGSNKAPYYWPWHRWPVDSHHKVLVRQKTYPCHDVINNGLLRNMLICYSIVAEKSAWRLPMTWNICHQDNCKHHKWRRRRISVFHRNVQGKWLVLWWLIIIRWSYHNTFTKVPVYNSADKAGLKNI